MKYIAETAAFVAALSASGAQAAPAPAPNDPSFVILPYTGDTEGTVEKRSAEAAIPYEPYVISIPTGWDEARRLYPEIYKRDAAADAFLGDIAKLVGTVIDKTTKRDAEAEPFLGDIAKLVGTVIDKTT